MAVPASTSVSMSSQPSADQAPAAVIEPSLPDYLRETYTWAYLDPRTVPWLDRPLVVSAILWGNARRLMDAAVAEFTPGQRVLQAAAVYGDFSVRLARQLGPEGALTVVDVARIQVANTRRKLEAWPTARVLRADLTEPQGTTFDAVCCFFLLHEVPPHARQRIVEQSAGGGGAGRQDCLRRLPPAALVASDGAGDGAGLPLSRTLRALPAGRIHRHPGAGRGRL